MPIFEYRAVDSRKACKFCRGGFETLVRTSDLPVAVCPECGAPVKKMISAPAVGSSRSGFDDRAKSAGFHKLKRLGKGEYEKSY